MITSPNTPLLLDLPSRLTLRPWSFMTDSAPENINQYDGVVPPHALPGAVGHIARMVVRATEKQQIGEETRDIICEFEFGVCLFVLMCVGRLI